MTGGTAQLPQALLRSILHRRLQIHVLHYIVQIYIDLSYVCRIAWQQSGGRQGCLIMNVKTLCLGILHFGDATGYEIKKMSLEGRFSHFIDVSFGSIYPALVRLTEEGLVSFREEHQSGRPDRKVYSITDTGRQAFLKALRTNPLPDKFKSEFLLQLMCADLIGPQRVAQIIDDRVALLTEDVTMLENALECCDHQGSRLAIGLGKAVYRAKLDYLKENRQQAIAIAEQAACKHAAE